MTKLNWRWEVNSLDKEAGKIMSALRKQGFKVKKEEPEAGGLSVAEMKEMKVVGIYVAEN